MNDQLGRPLHLNEIPKRIVSVVPSQTELLSDLGLDEEVVGITKFCVHPAAWFRNKTRVGGTKKININAVRALKPDIIFANKEENTKEDIEKLESVCPVWISDIRHFQDALSMILAIGCVCGKVQESENMVSQLKCLQAAFSQRENTRTDTALYLIWKDPYMAAGNDTFIHDMMKLAGFQNVIQSERYPLIEEQQIRELNPSCILLSSEPYPFKQKDAEALAIFSPASKIILVDGELFSWYGSRLLRSFEYFSALHEKLH